MNEVKTVNHIKNYISSKGYVLKNGTVENLYLSLKSNPLVLLAGHDESDKYSLIRLFAESINITSDNGRFKCVSPGGASDKILNHMGSTDIDGNFYPGEIFDFIIRASKDINYPYILYIDKINYVNPDEYLREILKLINTARRNAKGELISESVFDKSIFRTEQEKEIYGNVMLPENLYIICSTCISNESHVISEELKRTANTIEITAGNFDITGKKEKNCKNLTDVKNEFLKPEFLGESCLPENDFTETIVSNLTEINRLLRFYGKGFGIRTVNDIAAYLLTNSKYKLLTNDEAIDNCLLQKILPLIEGCEQGYKNILSLLFKQCVTKGVGDYYANSLKMLRALSYPNCRYKKSAEKIMLMTRRFEERGYCTL